MKEKYFSLDLLNAHSICPIYWPSILYLHFIPKCRVEAALNYHKYEFQYYHKKANMLVSGKICFLTKHLYSIWKADLWINKSFKSSGFNFNIVSSVSRRCLQLVYILLWKCNRHSGYFFLPSFRMWKKQKSTSFPKSLPLFVRMSSAAEKEAGEMRV